MATGKRTQRDIEWEQRTLCSDESCIGVIGPDGNCKECGNPYKGVLSFETVTATEKAPADEDEAAGENENDVETDEQPIDDPTSDDEWEKRTLCSDESCIGVIGPDGNCKECGKPYAG